MGELATRHVGNSGLAVSVVGIGCNNFGRRLDAEGTARVVHAALDHGITLFDTADIYGEGRSEEMLGAAVKGRRDGAVIATKFGGPMGAEHRQGASRRWIRTAVEDSLRRLGTEWIDLYQLHFPDSATPIDETLETLTDLVREGKIRYAGSSNFAGWQVTDAEWVARTRGFDRFISAQNRYSLLQRDMEAEVIPACAHHGIGLIPYSPLANGLLTGKHRRGAPPAAGSRIANAPSLTNDLLTDANFDVVEALERYASERGRTLLDVAIGGLAAQPQVVSVIAGAMSPAQVEANAQAASWQPSPDEMDELRRITSPSTVLPA